MRTPLSITLAVLFSLASAPAILSQDWPEYRGPARDGSQRGSEVFSSPFALEVAWSVPVGASYSGVVAADGVAVVMFSEGGDDFVAAFELEGGAERWRARVGDAFLGRHGAEGGPTSTPCISRGVVYAPGPAGTFHAFRLENGEPLWSVDLVASQRARIPVYGFGASPIAIEDVIYLSVGIAGGGRALAFEPESGAVRWSRAGTWVDYQSSVPLEETLLLATDAADVALLDVTSGDEVFRHRHVQGRPDLAYPQLTLVGDGRVLFSHEAYAELLTLDLTADTPFEPVWRSRELKQSYAPPVVHDGAVYGMSGTFLVCVDLETGRRRWKSREPSARGLILVDEHLVLFSSYGEVVVARASPEGYQEVARVPVGERGSYTPPSFADGRILVRNTSTLSCVAVVPQTGDSPRLVADDAPEPPGILGELARRLVAADDRAAELDRWWAAQPRFPIVEDDWVHFVFRGDAADVAVVGDMTRERGIPQTMERMPGTDLFHRSYRYEPDGLWQYTFLVDFESSVRDPANRRTAPAIALIPGNPQALGYSPADPESLLVMPGWSRPAFLEERADGGRLDELPFQSPNVPRPVTVTVYVPNVPEDELAELRALYVLGCEGWLEGGLKVALDNLMAEHCEPALAVCLPFHAGSLDRLDGSEYAQLVLDEVMPLVEERYSVGGPAAVLAAADDATGALALAFTAPERFPRAAVFSSCADPEDFELLEGVKGAPEAAYIEWSRYEPQIRDENTDYREASLRLKALLEERGCLTAGGEVVQGPGFPSWTSRLDKALALLLPRGDDQAHRR